VEVEALVDTGATRLQLKPSVIRGLGLEKVDNVISQTSNGRARRAVGENVPNLVGQIPLEYLDFVVDSKKRKLIPNPEHGGQQMSEEY
jgi:predicted aspartyl protease